MEKRSDDEITIHRPTGPRVSISPPLSLGELAIFKTKSIYNQAAKSLTKPVSFCKKHRKAIATFSISIFLTVCIDLAVTTIAKKGLAISPWIVTFGNEAAQTVSNPGTSYQGPGDVFASAFGWYSCARAYSASFALTQGAICQVADVGTGAITCDLKVGTNGFADLTSSSCAGGTLTVPAFCTTHTSCVVSKAYDQSGNGNDIIQATLARMPALVISGLNSLPVMNCNAAISFLQTAGTLTFSQPVTLSAAIIRSTGTAAAGFIGTDNTAVYIGNGGAGNVAISVAVGTGVTKTAADAAWHGIQGLLNGNGTSSAINVDGSDGTGAAGTVGWSGNNIRICRANGAQLAGSLAEAGIWKLSSTATDRGNIFTNQNGTNGYNGGL
jgi:hypothetical protein